MNIADPSKILLTRQDVSKHCTPDDCWVILDGVVYDVTEYWRVHPGGGHYLLRFAGSDATLGFREFNHSPFAFQQLQDSLLEVGRLEKSEAQQVQAHKKWTPKFEMEEMEDKERLTEDGMFCM